MNEYSFIIKSRFFLSRKIHLGLINISAIDIYINFDKWKILEFRAAIAGAGFRHHPESE